MAHLQWWPDRVLWIARTDTRLVAYDLERVLDGDTAAAVFPAPWPRKVGRAVDEHTVIASTSAHGRDDESVEHWLIDTGRTEVRGPIGYPGATPQRAVGFGRGRWLTADRRGRYEIWTVA